MTKQWIWVNMLKLLINSKKSEVFNLWKVNHVGLYEDSECFKCQGCHACNVISEASNFSSTNTKKTYKIKQRITCDTPYVIYLSTCKKCQGQYVGKSIQAFKRRHSGHKQEVKNVYGGLGHHYGGEAGCGYSNMSFVLIEHTVIGDKEVLANREVFWQHQLRCFIENGQNAHCYRKEIWWKNISK